MMRLIHNSKAFVVAALLLLVSANRITMDENGGGQSSLLQAIPGVVPWTVGEAAEAWTVNIKTGNYQLNMSSSKYFSHMLFSHSNSSNVCFNRHQVSIGINRVSSYQ
jgi:hypothetical protein